jgi:acyl-CoA thioester hydrolase
MITARTNHLRDFYNFDSYEHGNVTGNNWVVSRTRINYLTPIKFNDQVNIQTRLVYSDERRIVPETVIYSPDKTKIHALAWIEFVYFNIARARPTKHTPELMEFFRSIAMPIEEFHLEKIDQRVTDIRRMSSVVSQSASKEEHSLV